MIKAALLILSIWHASLLAAPPDQGANTDEPHAEKVLVLWSFPRAFPWISGMDRFFSDFARREVNQRISSQAVSLQAVSLQEQNLPFQEGVPARWAPYFLKYVAEKYAGQHFDRIVAIDGMASKFMGQHHHLFSYDALYQITVEPLPDIPKTVELKPGLNTGERDWPLIDQAFTPDAKTTFLVANQHSLLYKNGLSIRETTSWLDSGNYTLLDPAVMSLSAIQARLREDAQNSRIIYLPVTQTTDTPSIIPQHFLSQLSEGLDQPILCAVSSFVGAGCVAGFGLSSRLFAKLAAEAVYGSLMPGSHTQLTELMLDEAKMESLGRTRPSWYGEGLVVNPQLAVWERYSQAMAVGGLLIGVFTVIVLALSRQRTQINSARLNAQSKQARLDNILKGTNVGTWEWNVQTGETRFNERWAEIVGYSLHELQPTTIDTWMEFAHPTDLEGSDQRLEAHFKGEAEFYEVEARMKHRLGHWVWVLDRGQVATWTSDGKPEWMYGTHQDITKRKQLEEDLKARSAESENALKTKSEFLAAMSHEIRTPMNGVLGLAGLARRSSDIEKKNFYLDGITRSGKLLMSILNDVLDFSRLEAGRTRLQPEGFEVENLFTESVDLFRASAESKGLTLLLELAPNTPSRLLGDPIKLSQMVNNFVGNAIKFTARGKITLSVKCEHLNNRTHLRFECHDTGIGIAEDDIQQLFKPFSQVAGDPRIKAAGTGLGLVLVQEYAKLMGGQCGVNSTLGQGSTFWFEVMLDKTEALANNHQTEQAVDPSLLQGRHILVVEDNPMNVMIIEAILDEYHITHNMACNGVEAIRLFENSVEQGSQPYDAILMDVQMPVMGGLEATRTIKSSQKPSPPVLGLTAAVLPDEMAACQAAGMDAFIAKPIDTRTLFSELLRLINPHPCPSAPPR